MSTYQGVRVTSSTAGSPAPGIEELSGGYHFQRDPEWTPNHPRYREPGPASFSAGGTAARQAQRQERLDAFAAALKARGVTPATATTALVIEAGKQVGVAPKTARRYRAELKQQQGERRDA